MKISYLLTCSNETDTLRKLLELLGTAVKNSEADECVVLIDTDTTGNELTKGILAEFSIPMAREIVETKQCKIFEHSLNKNYGAHKNFGIEQCTGDYILQLDGDELPSDYLIGDNLRAIIKANPTIEAFAVPRINDFRGVTPLHATQWGWRLSESPRYKRPVVNWPDYQFRIFKRDYPRISFLRRLHEKIEGYANYVTLPADEEFALYHDKTIEAQLNTNMRYNKWFTAEENHGHNVFDQQK